MFIVTECQLALGGACPVLPGSEPNSVAIHGNLMAIAMAPRRTDNQMTAATSDPKG